jgi:hypothetical protein
VQQVLKKSRDAVKSFHQFSEESKFAFLLSPILIKERPALIRKPKAQRGNSAQEAPPGVPVDLAVLPVSIVPPPSDLLPACLVQPPAPAPPPTPHAAPTLAAPMPRPSPGQQINNGAQVRLLADTTPGSAPVRATGLLFATVEGYEGGGEYLVKGPGSDGRASRSRVSGDFLVPQSLDGIGAMLRHSACFPKAWMASARGKLRSASCKEAECMAGTSSSVSSYRLCMQCQLCHTLAPMLLVAILVNMKRKRRMAAL